MGSDTSAQCTHTELKTCQPMHKGRLSNKCRSFFLMFTQPLSVRILHFKMRAVKVRDCFMEIFNQLGFMAVVWTEAALRDTVES